MPWNLQATTDSPGPAQIGCAAVLALWMTSARQGFDVLHRAITSEWRLLPAEREQPPDLRAHPPGPLEVQLQARIRAAAGCDGQRAASAGPSSELSAVASERSSRLASGTAQSVWASFDLVEAAVHRDRQDDATANVGADASVCHRSAVPRPAPSVAPATAVAAVDAASPVQVARRKASRGSSDGRARSARVGLAYR